MAPTTNLERNKANALVGLIRRTFSFLDARLFKKLYVSFVRPHLEYAQVVWSPYLKKYRNMLENVQIRATKLVDGMANIPHHERLKALKLPTLAYRRACGDMIEVLKHIHIYNKKNLTNLDLQSENHVWQLNLKDEKLFEAITNMISLITQCY